MVGNYHREVGAADPIIQRLADEDKVPWYKKPNLRIMYFWLFITCMGVEITSGFDSQMINALQIVPSWKEYFNDPQGTDKSLLLLLTLSVLFCLFLLCRGFQTSLDADGLSCPEVSYS